MRSRHVLAGLLLLLVPGCALIKQGTTQTIIIDSKPSRAEFVLNGETFVTPCERTLPKEEHTLVFKKRQGFEETPVILHTRTSSYFYWSLLMGFLAGGVDWITGAWREFDIPEGDTIVFSLKRAVDPLEQEVSISSNPPNATIRIGKLDLQEKTGVKGRGKKIIVKWASEKEREMTVVLRYPGYRDHELRLRRDQPELHQDLEPNPEKSTVSFVTDPRGAEVLIDGIPATATTPVDIPFEWYRHTQPRKIEIRKDGHHPKFLTLSGKADSCPPMKLEEVINTVPVAIECVPAGSLIEVNGQPVAEGPAEIKLDFTVTRKSYKLRISRAGYESASRDVTVDDAQSGTPLTIRLKPSLPTLP